jgi:hypothetical protein
LHAAQSVLSSCKAWIDHLPDDAVADLSSKARKTG